MTTLAMFGDSLTEGHGLRNHDALPAVLERMLAADGFDITVRNFGVSGDTSEDGLARLKSVLKAKPDAVAVEFGANDLFVGDEPDYVFDNLETLCTAFLSKGIPVLLVGVTALLDVGTEYKAAFDPIFEKLASKLDIPLYPDILAPYFGNSMLTLIDGLHPNEAGVRRIAQDMYPQIRELVQRT